MISAGYERISPTPNYPAGLGLGSLSAHTWDSKAVNVQHFKSHIKAALRKAQAGHCCFCRRLLFDDYATHIEHFIEKKAYPQFTFVIRNLALACGTCNAAKNGHNSKLQSFLKRRAFAKGVAYMPQPPVLVSALAVAGGFPTGGASYRWVHPHFDNYSSEIHIQKGWVFVGKTRKGSRTIRGVRLNEITTIEGRALRERMLSRGGLIATLIAATSELSVHEAGFVADLVAEYIRRRIGLQP